MDRCARNGIHVIVDLHAGPGCVSTKHAANIIPDDYDASELAKAWEIIAARLKDHPATYAYDILNEPSVAPATWVRVCEEVMRATRRIDPAAGRMIWELLGRFVQIGAGSLLELLGRKLARAKGQKLYVFFAEKKGDWDHNLGSALNQYMEKVTVVLP